MPVILLVHCNGNNGSSSFADESLSNHTLTATTATVTSVSPKFGSGCADFTGSTAARINTGTSADFNLGSGRFTIEAWAYFTSAPSGTQAIAAQFGASANLGWFFGLGLGNLSLTYSTTGTDVLDVHGAFSPTLNTWYHLAVDRDASNVVRVYVNGAVIASGTVSATIFPSTQNCLIGNDNNNTRAFPGRLDEIRINIGAAMYGGAFTPATAPFTANSSWSTTDKSANQTLSNGNLTATSTSATLGGVRTLKSGAVSGKWYWEITFTTNVDASSLQAGVTILANSLSSIGVLSSGAVVNGAAGSLWANGTFIAGMPATTPGGTMCFAMDAAAGLVWIRVGAAGQWNGSGTADPATGTGGLSPVAGGAALYPFYRSQASGEVATANFGDTAFVGAVPSGFYAGYLPPPVYTSWSLTDRAGVTLSNSNLTANSLSIFTGVRANDGPISGKYYFEYTLTNMGSSDWIGMSNVLYTLGNTNLSNTVYSDKSGTIRVNGVNSGSIGARTNGDIIGIAFDLTAELIWFRVAPAGNWNGSGTANPATGIGGFDISAIAFTALPFWPTLYFNGSGAVITGNFGDSAFSSTVPSGFTAGIPYGAAGNTSEVVTQAFVEEWAIGTPALQLTQAIVEEWVAPNSDAEFTQIALEQWAGSSPQAQLTQIAIEQWATVPVIQLRGTSTGPNSNATSTAISLPAAVQVGDVSIIAYLQASTPGTPPTLTPPAGWTTILNANGTLICWRTYQAGDPTTGITATSTLSNWWESLCAAYKGLDTINPVDAQISNFSYANSDGFSGIPTLCRAPSLCPNFIGGQLLCVYTYSSTSANTITLPVGLNDVVSTGAGPVLRMSDKPLIDGTPTGTFDATMATASRGQLFFGMAIALKAIGATAATLAPARPQVVGTWNQDSNSASMTLPLVALNVQNGDMVVVAIAGGLAASTVPAGYIQQSAQSGAVIYTHLWSSGDNLAPIFTFPAGYVSAAVSLVRRVGVSAAPITFDKIAVATNTGNPATTLIATQTPTNANELLLVLLGSSNSNGGTWSAITPGLTDEIIISTGPGLRWSWMSPAASPTGTFGATWSTGVSVTLGGASMLLATVPPSTSLTPSMVLSASRAGIGSVILNQDNATRTVNIADVGVVSYAAPAPTSFVQSLSDSVATSDSFFFPAINYPFALSDSVVGSDGFGVPIFVSLSDNITVSSDSWSVRKGDVSYWLDNVSVSDSLTLVTNPATTLSDMIRSFDTFSGIVLTGPVLECGPIPLFPPLPAGFPVKVSIVMDTTIGTTKSLREVRVAQQAYPLWDIELVFEELVDQTQNQVPYLPFANVQQYESLVSHWLLMYGQAGLFAFDAPWDDSRTDQVIARGDGGTTSFPVFRSWGFGTMATVAPVGLIGTVTNVKINGSIVDPTLYDTSRSFLNFNTAPANGAVITMTFGYYYVCRFIEDEQNFEEFEKNRWTVPNLKFRAVYWPGCE